MTTIILVVHLIIAVTMCGIILLQRSEGGALGMGGGGSGGGLMTARGTANLLTRVTAILAIAFICTSMLLAILATRSSDISILDQQSVEEPVEEAPAEPEQPSAPLAN